MPSNTEYARQAKELASKLGISVNTDGLSNQALGDLVSDLRAKVKDASKDTQADQAESTESTSVPAEPTPDSGPPDSAAAEAAAKKEAAQTERVAKAKEAAAKKPPYYVAPGKSITSKRGIRSGDTEDEVKASDLAGGQKALDDFVESGHILKGG